MARPTPQGQCGQRPECIRTSRSGNSPRVWKSTNSTVLYKSTKTATYSSGHGLWKALCYLGYQEVPVQVLGYLTEAQKQTFLIADNQIGANSTWDDKKLEITLENLKRNSSIRMLSDSVRRNSIGFWRTWSRRTWPETQRTFRRPPPRPSPSQATHGYFGTQGTLRDSLLGGNLERVLGGRGPALPFATRLITASTPKRKEAIKSPTTIWVQTFRLFFKVRVSGFWRSQRGPCIFAYRVPRCTRWREHSKWPGGTGQPTSYGLKTASPWAVLIICANLK